MTSGVVPTCRRVTLALCVLLAGRAQAQVDPSGEWRTLHTAHFRVHFRPATRAAAEHEAREAERAYALLSRELRPPRGVVDLVLGDDIDAANGFATMFPSNRLTVFAAPPTTAPRGGGASCSACSAACRARSPTRISPAGWRRGWRPITSRG